VFVHHNFLTKDQLAYLQNDMELMKEEGRFVVNGLSDVRKGLKGEVVETAGSMDGEEKKKSNQGFDVKVDRSVCPVPWWKHTLENSLGGECADGETLPSIQLKLQQLRFELSRSLGRPTMLDSNLGHECYYSESAPGSSLARHMDERHEETKGPRGWLLPSRRSLSWLIYLSDTGESDIAGEGWDARINGGLLRTFPQKHYRQHDETTNNSSYLEKTVDCGSHNGNLQVGWLLGYEIEENEQQSITHPVFLDSWFDFTNPYTGMAEPHCILYIVREKPGQTDHNHMEIEYITGPWSTEAVPGNVLEFLHTRAELESSDQPVSPSLFLNSKYARQFSLLEDRQAWMKGSIPDGAEIEDFVPTRGTLVVFDSVTLPHEVTPVFRGKRAALAGWFHEETQPLGGNVVI